ncbi:MAG TPA: ankyrin repeat domain-containing protein, partial [Nakamurella sp.]
MRPVFRAASALPLFTLLLAACAGPTPPAPIPTPSSSRTAEPSSSSPAATPSAVPATTAASPPAAPAPLPTRNPALDQPLRDAAWANDVPAAAELIAAGADVNAKDDTEQSAYLIATSEGYLDLLELTLAHGADLTSLDSFRGTGLIRAAERGHAA